MTDAAPPWLVTARVLTGTHEVPGVGDNPTILNWGQAIGRKFPEMASYAREYTHDSIAWCGYFLGYCFAVNGIRPPFGPTDTDRFMWAAAWAGWGTRVSEPQLGDVLVLDHHVTLFNGRDGDSYLGLGGNQSDSVNVQHYNKARILTIRRPPPPEKLPDVKNIPEKPEPVKPMPEPQPKAPDVTNQDLLRVLDGIAKLLVQVDGQLKQSGSPGLFSLLLPILARSLPQLGVWGLVASVVLNALGALGGSPILPDSTPAATTSFAGAIGALLSGLLMRFPTKEPTK